LNLPLPRAQQDTIQAAENYIHQTPRETQDDLDAWEEEARQARVRVQDSEVDAKMLVWITNVSSTRARDMKYYRIIDLY
jgi:predicted O-methyltransferase YrrM